MSLGRTISLSVDRVVEPVEGMHRAITGRWFSTVGSSATPVKQVHDPLVAAVYASIRLTAAAVGATVDLALSVRSDRADAVQAFTNGLWGDRLGRHQASLGISMALRDRHGRPVAIPGGLETTFPNATGHLVVLVHGLINTERVWQKTAKGEGVLERLEAHPELTPVSVRYNSGQSVASNGERLSALVGRLRQHWPVPVESISLVGHSMGGLVIRAACVFAAENDADWVGDAATVVTLGSPHLGTPLEKLVNATARGLNIANETRPLADFLNKRSQGIKDLRFGTTTSDEVEPESLLVKTGSSEPLPEGIAHRFVAGVVTADRHHPVGIAMGDMLVPTSSATGGDRLEPTEVVVVGGARHSELVRERVVVDQVLEWLTPST